MRSEAEAESSGRFTVDLEAAKRAVARLAGLEPGLVLGRLLQAAVASNARAIDFQVSSSGMSAEIDFGDDTRSVPRVQDYLASAVALGLALNPSSLNWSCADFKREFVGGSTDTRCLPTDGASRFHLRLPAASNRKRLAGWFSRSRSPVDFLVEHASLCPIPVVLDGARINRTDRISPWSGCEVMHLISQRLPASKRFGSAIPESLRAHKVFLGGRLFRGERSFALDGQKMVVFEGLEAADTLEHGDAAPRGLTLCQTWAPSRFGLSSKVISRLDWCDADDYWMFKDSQEPAQQALSTSRWITLGQDARPSQLLPVMDGLILMANPLPRCRSGHRVIMPVEKLNLDLHQLQVVQDKAFDDFQDQLQAEFIRLRKAWAKHK